MLTAAPAVAGLGPMSDGFDNAVVHLWDASKLSDATRYMAGRVSDDPGASDIIARDPYGDRMLLVIFTSVGNMSSYERAKIIADRLNQFRKDHVYWWRNLSAGEATTKSGSKWGVLVTGQAISNRKPTVLIYTDPNTEAKFGMSGEQLATYWTANVQKQAQFIFGNQLSAIPQPVYTPGSPVIAQLKRYRSFDETAAATTYYAAAYPSKAKPEIGIVRATVPLGSLTVLDIYEQAGDLTPY